ncbi:hypothetical protein LWI28_020462 [Acer negundo]|uniref:Uncharacterized protein n=1 Tax=Acer negundo TaxID=4023 RepID=A0AAD5J5X2_ACENE|nr:hypothetical protein LWI28_020462 [Acer negundo]
MTRSEKGEPWLPENDQDQVGQLLERSPTLALQQRRRSVTVSGESGKHLEEARRRMKSDQGQIGVPPESAGKEEAASEKRRSYAGNGRTAPTSSLGRGTSPPTAAAAAGCRRRPERKLIRALIPYRI